MEPTTQEPKDTKDESTYNRCGGCIHSAYCYGAKYKKDTYCGNYSSHSLVGYVGHRRYK